MPKPREIKYNHGDSKGVADGRAPYASGEDIPNDSTAQVRVSKLPGRKWPLSFASSIHTAWPAAGEKGGGVRVRAAPVLRESLRPPELLASGTTDP